MNLAFIQVVKLHKPRRWGRYSLPGGFWAVMLGCLEIRLRWPPAYRFWVRER